MGTSRFESKEKVRLTYLGDASTFYVLPDDTIVPEDGFIGLQFMKQRDYNLSNKHLVLKRKTHALITDGITVPPSTAVMITIAVDGPDRDCLITMGAYDKTTENGEVHEFEAAFVNRIENGHTELMSENPTDKVINFDENQIRVANVKMEGGDKDNTGLSPGQKHEFLLENSKLDHLEPAQKEIISGITLKYQDIFTSLGQDLPAAPHVKHKIVPINDTPINIGNFKTAHAHRIEIKTQVADMLKKGIIRESESPSNSPV